jgi:hypothetical protein
MPGAQGLYPTGSIVTTNTFFAKTTMYCDGGQDQAPPRASTIHVFINFGGGHYQISREHPLGSPPMMSSSTLVVAAAGSTSQRAHHQRLHQLRWWQLPVLPVAPPRGAAIDIWLNLLPVIIIFWRHLQGGTMLNTTTTIKTSFTKKYFQILDVLRTKET